MLTQKTKLTHFFNQFYFRFFLNKIYRIMCMLDNVSHSFPKHILDYMRIKAFRPFFFFLDEKCVLIGHGCFLAEPSCYTYALTVTLFLFKFCL